MGWKTINGHRYYYRSVREGDRVRTEYVGGGELGSLAALLDREDQVEKELSRVSEREDREADDEVEKALDDLTAEARRQAEAFLNSQGYYQHKRGEWRKRRGGTDNQAG